MKFMMKRTARILGRTTRHSDRSRELQETAGSRKFWARTAALVGCLPVAGTCSIKWTL